MTCEEFIPFIDAYVDQEFDERELVEMELHLSSCAGCKEHVDYSVQLKRAVKECLESERAPAGLKEAIFSDIEARSADLEEEAALLAAPRFAAVAAPQLPAPAQKAPVIVRYGRVVVPLAAAVAVMIALPSFTVAPAKSGQLPIVEQTVDWHVGNYPIEVTGPDAGRVAQWFRNKVDFPVRLPHFAPDRQVNLLGGRIAHVQDRRAAYLLYEVDGTRLSVLVFNGEGLTIPGDKIRTVGGRDLALLNNKGYEVALLQDSGVTYTITSELAEPEFVSLVSSTLH